MGNRAEELYGARFDRAFFIDAASGPAYRLLGILGAPRG
jgi:hypothetical protein